jgi:hypothetical protein
VNVPDTSRFCRENKHDDCSHWYGMGSDYVHLCQCTCHEGCPVKGARCQTRVLKQQCTCPGARAWRALEDEMRPRLEEQQRELAERSEKAQAALRSIKRRPGATESEIRDELARAYEEHGIEPLPGELDLAAGAIRSWTAPKGRHAPQSVGMIARFVGHLAAALRGNAPLDEDGSANHGDGDEPGER